MIAWLLWFVLGLFVAGYVAFVASHYLRLTLRQLAVVCLVGYGIAVAGLSLIPDASRTGLLWIFSTSVPLSDSWKPLLGCYAAFILWILYFIPRYEALGLGPQQGTIRTVMFPFRAVALTFDDGPSPEWTPRVLDVLRKHQVKATFFMVGEAVERHPDIVRRIAKEGHTVGSHSWSHRIMPLLDAKTLGFEIDRASEALEKALGFKSMYFRPPWGMYNRRVLDELRARGYLTVLWSRSSQDWRNPGVDEIVRFSTHNPKLGELVLMHDGGNYPNALNMSRDQTVQALDRLIPALERQGFQFKTVDEMVRAWLS